MVPVSLPLFCTMYTRLQTVWSLPGHSRHANKGHSPRCHRRPNGPGRLADKVVQPTTQYAEGCTYIHMSDCLRLVTCLCRSVCLWRGRCGARLPTSRGSAGCPCPIPIRPPVAAGAPAAAGLRETPADPSPSASCKPSPAVDAERQHRSGQGGQVGSGPRARQYPGLFEGVVENDFCHLLHLLKPVIGCQNQWAGPQNKHLIILVRSLVSEIL